MAIQGSEEKKMNVELKRQIVHGSGILFILALQVFGRMGAAVLFFLAFIFLLFWGHLRKSNTSIKPLTNIEQFVEHELKGYERPGEYFQGAATFFLGSLLAVLLFPVDVATACIAVLAAGDAFSTLIGKLYGKHKLPINKEKSWEGSITFLIVSFAILWLFDPTKALYIAPIVTLVEMLPKVDDNITIPLAIGFLFLL